MNLPEIAIRRPVFASMMSIGLVIFGVIGLQRLAVRELPDIDAPIVNVLTVYPGASAEIIETEITEKLEDAINGIEGLRTMRSTSRDQVSTIGVEFSLSRNIDVAAQDVRDAVARVRRSLPEDIDDPVVSKQDADARPFMWIALFGENFSTEELTRFAEDNVKDVLQTVDGVSSVIVGGSKNYAVRIRLDPGRMAAHGITVTDVEQVIRNENLELPSGRIEGRMREMSIRTFGELADAEQFNRLVIRETDDRVVRLRDIGFAEDGVEDERSVARYNSQPSVGLGIVRQSQSNVVEIARALRAEMESLQRIFPEGVEYFFAYDESIFVERAIREVWITLGIAFSLVVFTIFVFLRNIRTTIVPVITIPVSIITTFGFLYVMGFSINIVTMLALVLAIGVVVDDSIVVLENIYRHIEEGMRPMEAAFKGMKEILFAVIATTVSLVVVFAPMALQTTQVGRLFVEFAFTIAGSVIISSFVALTLTPMIASRALRAKADSRPHGRIFNFFERRLDQLTALYLASLRLCLRFRYGMIGVFAGVLGLSYFLFTQLEGDFLPNEDKDRLFTLILTPEGSTSEYTDAQVRRAEAIIADYPEVAGYFSAVALPFAGPGQATLGLAFVRLQDRSERSRPASDIVNGPGGMGARLFSEIEGALAFPNLPKAIDVGGFGQPFQLVIQNRDLEELNAYSQSLLNRLRGEGMLQRPRVNFEYNRPELRVIIDRDRAAALNVSVREISRSLQLLLGGSQVSQVKRGNREFPVIIQVERERRLTPELLRQTFVRARTGELVQLSNVVSTEEAAGPNAIYHYNRQRAATIEATPAPGVTVGEAVERTREILAETLPIGFRYAFEGEARQYLDAGGELYFIMALALLIVYMVLASQFESLIHPLTIMVAVAMAALGAFGGLYLLGLVNDLGEMLHAWVHFGGDAPGWAETAQRVIPRIPAMNLNFFALIGLVLLIALVTKNGILLVEFANQRVNAGMSAMDAVIEAGRIRFRPILMTSLATIAGILPVAIGFGAGSESRRPLGVVAVSGMATSTFLTVVMVPVFYVLFDSLRNKLRSKQTETEAASPPVEPAKQIN